MSASTRTVILILGLSVFLATKKDKSRNTWYSFNASYFFRISLNKFPAEGIIKGSYASGGRFKYQISLQRNGYHNCGGTIIGDCHILTAAHCFLDTGFKPYEGSTTVIADEVDLNKMKSSVITADVEKIYIPTDYKPDPSRPLSMYTGDIAVLKSKTCLGLDKNRSIGKADLPQPGVTYEGVKAIASGFGFNRIENYTDPQTNQVVEQPISEHILRYISLNIISNSDCQKIYGPVTLSSQHLCGKAVKLGEGTCGGDSGGPLVYKNTIIGVVSAGIAACGDEKTPEVYTRVSSYLDFINKAMSDDQSRITYIPV